MLFYLMITDGYKMNARQSNTKKSESKPEKASSPQAETIAFKDLGLEQEIINSLDKVGFSEPTEIQAKSIPHLLQKKDIIAQAKTGSGKTLAFALPAIHHIQKSDATGVLVMVPTRELAQQVAEEFKRFGSPKRNLKTTCIIGRQSYDTQISALNRGATAIIATPGRLLDLLSSGKVKNFNPNMVVLDEADEMLNMGFIEDIKKIFDFLPQERQTIFFSATFPTQIKNLAQRQQKDPVGIYLNNGKQKQENDDIEQTFYVVSERERELALLRLIKFEQPKKAIVFCRTKKDTEILQSKLVQENVKAKSLHGDLTQSERTLTLRHFKSGLITTLVATDVASRGIDIEDVSHVFNFHIPENRDRYTHRIGRTGRAGRLGKAMTLTTSSEWQNHFFLRQINRNSVKFAQIPTSEKLEEHLNQKFLGQLKETNITLSARKFCEKISADEDAFDLLCKLYTLTTDHKKVLGPSKIGLSQKDISFLLSRARQHNNSSRGRSRNFRSSFRGRDDKRGRRANGRRKTY